MKDLSNHYKLHILSSGDYECLVVCLSYESIFSYMNELKADMRKHNIKKGNILFDQLLICGNGKNRFLSVEIEDGDFLQATAKNVVADQYYHELTASELRKNQSILENSILTPEQIAMISKGIVIKPEG